MLSVRVTTCLLIAAGLAALVMAGDATGPKRPPKKGGQLVAPKKLAPKADHEVIQEFPTNGEMETAWKVRWATATGYGLYIKDAFFKRAPKDRWIQVLGDSRISEIFVPYHRGSPRFWDVSYNFPLCICTPDDAGPNGKLLRDKPGAPPTVVQEVRDRGIIYKSYNRTRRGQTLVLFGTLEAANYRYIIEYGFQDDGGVTFRMGSTGHNYGGSEYEGHMHNGLWRVNVNLDGTGDNSVYLVEHVEPMSDLKDEKSRSKTLVTPFNGGREGFCDWKPERFTHLRVVNDKYKNGKGDAMAYDLVSSRMGNARHRGGNREDCTHHDFWVTRAKPGEIVYTNLPKYVADGESVMNTDVVLWHSAPMHHEPRLEDGKMVGGSLQGVTHVMWAGFMLRPRNFFDGTPLYQHQPR